MSSCRRVCVCGLPISGGSLFAAQCPKCNSGITIQRGAHSVLLCPFSFRLCAFISMFCLRCHSQRSVAQLELSENVLQHPLRPTNYGLWLFPFCFTECGTVAKRRAGRKASTIDCLSFGPNWAKWEWLLPEFALLQCLHADPPERRSLTASLKTPVDTFANTQAHTHNDTHIL